MVWIFAFLTHTLLRFNINTLKRNSTPEQFQEYVDNYNWKYSVEFLYPHMHRHASNGNKLHYGPIYFTQVSESDAEVFENWLTKKNGSFLELKDHRDHVTKVYRKTISFTRVRIEAVPRKLRTKELYAIYEKDGTLIYSFEDKQKKDDSKNSSKLCLIPLICCILIPATRIITICCLIDFLIWKSYNMSYLLKNYPLCRVQKLHENKNVDFFKK